MAKFDGLDILTLLRYMKRQYSSTLLYYLILNRLNAIILLDFGKAVEVHYTSVSIN